MEDEMSDGALHEAMFELKDTIFINGSDKFDSLCDDIAEDHGVKSVLLRRRFIQTYGDPTALYRREIESKKADSIALNAQRNSALNEAKSWASQYGGTCKYTGMTFDIKGEEHIFVVIDLGAITWAGKAVRVHDLKHVEFTKEELPQILKTLKPY